MRKVKIFLVLAVFFFVTLTMVFAQEPKAFTVVNPQNYQQEVGDFSGPQIVFFYAAWCPFSGSLLPVYEEVEKGYTGQIKFCRFELGSEYMDFQSQEGKSRWELLKTNYGVNTIPSLIMFNQGKEIDRMSGRPEKEIVDSYRMFLKQWIESNLITPQADPYLFEGTLRLRQAEKR